MSDPGHPPILPHDVFALTDRGSNELRGGSTGLSAQALEVLVLIDGKRSVADLGRHVRTVTPEALAPHVRSLLNAGYVRTAKADDDPSSLDFTYFFSRPSPAPDETQRTRAAREAANGASELQHAGFYVSIARRATTAAAVRKDTLPSVLIVEDEPQVAKFVRKLLEIEGFEPRIAATREEIVAELKRDPLPDLVLLDVVMPEVSGFQVLERMKAHPMLRTLPVIMLTAQANVDGVMRGLAGGADGYITKPFEMDVLMKGIRAVLGMTGSTGPAR